MTHEQSESVRAALSAIITAIDQCIALGEFATARALCAQGTALAPDHAPLLLRRARLAVIGKDFAAAAADYRRVVAAMPGEGRAWLEYARAAARILAWDEAAAAFERALALSGRSADVLAELGHVEANRGGRPVAIACFRESLALMPDQPDVANDLAAHLIETHDFDAARAVLETVLGAHPEHRRSLQNMAVIEDWAGRSDRFLDLHRRMVAAEPADAATHQALGTALLSRGRLSEGWAEYRWRFRNQAHRGWHRGIGLPLLADAPLRGRHLLVWSDQGLGEQILLAGLLAEAERQCARLVFACEPRLFSLLRRTLPGVGLAPITELHTGKVDLSGLEAQASISEIGPLLRPDLAAFPRHGGYLKPDPARVAALRARYAALPGEGPVIGLSWRSINVLAGAEKSIGLAAWGAILARAPARFVSLQYGDTAADLADARRRFGLEIFSDAGIDPVADLDGFAAQVAAVDLVISTSNTTVHMAGAMGVPTLCLTPRAEGRPWCWIVGTATSPWYPSVRHVWQSARGRWDDALAHAAALARGVQSV